MTFDKKQTVREIAISNPATLRVFEDFGIVYCCGGKRPLLAACAVAKAPIGARGFAYPACWLGPA